MNGNIKWKGRKESYYLIAVILFMFMTTFYSANTPPNPVYSNVEINNSNAPLSSAVNESMGDCNHCIEAVIGSVDPSVDNRVSDKYNLTIVYDIEEKHKPYYDVPNGKGDGCNNTYTYMSKEGPEGKLTIEYYKESELNPGEMTEVYNKTYEINDEGKNSQILDNNIFTDSNGNTTGYEKLITTIDSAVIYNYSYVKEKYENGTCKKGNQSYKTFPYSSSDSKEYIVESGKPLLFLVRPVLKEQLIQDSRYDVWIFTKKKIKNAEAKIDGKNLRNITMFDLIVHQNDNGYEMYRVVSNKNESEGVRYYEIRTNPYLIQKPNQSADNEVGGDIYRYFYEINNSYSKLGKHNLSLTVYDSFGEKYKINNTITSRKMGFNGTDPNVRQIVKPEIKKEGYSKLEFDNLKNVCGLVGIVFLVLFVLRLAHRP